MCVYEGAVRDGLCESGGVSEFPTRYSVSSSDPLPNTDVHVCHPGDTSWD